LVVALVVALGVALAVTACGSEATGAEGGAGQAPGGGGGAAAGGTDLPNPSQVIFGTSYDPSSLAVAGTAKSLKAGSQIVAVGRTLAPHAASEIKVRVTLRAAGPDPFPVTAAANPDSTDLFAADLTPLKLQPGTWTVAFVNSEGRVFASADLNVTP
jgi:hypothetical protein